MKKSKKNPITSNIFFKFINYYIRNIHYNKNNDIYNTNNNIFNIINNIKLTLPKFKWFSCNTRSNSLGCGFDCKVVS